MDFVKGRVNWTRKVKVSFTPSSQKLIFKNNEKLEYSYRIFIFKGRDIILERKDVDLTTIYGEPSYSRINFITHGKVRFITLLKMSESQFLDDKQSGYLFD